MQVFTHKLIYLRKECGYLQPKNHFHLAWDLNELHSCRSYTYHEGRTEIYLKLIVEKALIKEKVQVNYGNNVQKSVGLGHVMYFFRLRVHWFENKIITDRIWNGKSFRKAKFCIGESFSNAKFEFCFKFYSKTITLTLVFIRSYILPNS